MASPWTRLASPLVAARQVQSYLNGRDGLVGNHKDPDPRPKTIETWEKYKEDRPASEPVHEQPVAQAESNSHPSETGSDLHPDRDTDSDGLTDAFEKLAGTNPSGADSDSDGLPDGYEAAESHTDPLSADGDRDGIPDGTELALGSNAGRLPGIAGVVGAGVFAENIRGGMPDADADGLSDHAERVAGLDVKNPDSDGDGLRDGVEAAFGTDPLLADSDHDGLTDELEVRSGSDPLGSFVDSSGTEVRTAPWTLEAAAARVAAGQEPAGQPHEAAAAATASSVVQHDPYAIDTGRALGAGSLPLGTEHIDRDTPDGLTDAFEKLAGTGVTVAGSDANGLNEDLEAVRHSSNPLGPTSSNTGVAPVIGAGAMAESSRAEINDTDSDGLTDGTEKHFGSDATRADSDGDLLSDPLEIALGTNPLLADTDGDGILDSAELRFGTSPLSPGSTVPADLPVDVPEVFGSS